VAWALKCPLGGRVRGNGKGGTVGDYIEGGEAIGGEKNHEMVAGAGLHRKEGRIKIKN